MPGNNMSDFVTQDGGQSRFVFTDRQHAGINRDLAARQGKSILIFRLNQPEFPVQIGHVTHLGDPSTHTPQHPVQMGIFRILLVFKGFLVSLFAELNFLPLRDKNQGLPV